MNDYICKCGRNKWIVSKQRLKCAYDKCGKVYNIAVLESSETFQRNMCEIVDKINEALKK
jgi:hypothetical protein